MLGRTHRMKRPADFRAAVRAGARAATGTVVLHLLLAGSDGPPDDARIGFIVNRSVGPAVVRNRVRRQLRHALRPVVAEVPHGSLLVVRVLPAAAAASGDQLRADLASCLARVRRKSGLAVPE